MKKIALLLLLTILTSGCSSKQTTPAPQQPSQTEVAPKQQEPATSPQTTTWLGTWTRSGAFDPSVLKIEKEMTPEIQFRIDASSGGNIGNLAGTATKSGTTATFADKQGCTVTFSHEADSIKVTTTETCSFYAGNGVRFDGTYKSGTGENEQTDLVKLGVLPDQDLNQKFQNLVGADYSLFTERYQLTSDAPDLDGFKATVKTGGVRGLFTIMEAIIMFDANGKFWAAVIDNTQVKYYTTEDAWKQKLPKTMEEWRKNFSDLPIVYQK